MSETLKPAAFELVEASAALTAVAEAFLEGPTPTEREREELKRALAWVREAGLKARTAGVVAKCKVCGLEHDSAGWERLKFKGYVGALWSGKRRYACQLRDCTCGTTLGVEVLRPFVEAAPSTEVIAP